MYKDKTPRSGLNRREFLVASALTGLGLLARMVFPASLAYAADPIMQPPLPYPMNALEPVISARTLEFHYGKHHAAYVANTNKMLPGSGLEGKPLEAVVRASAGKADMQGLFNNAAQAWNHTFYWNCMKPKGGGQPGGKVLEALKTSFGGYDGFKKAFADSAVGRFGSGWAWLVQDGSGLKIMSTSNADTPLAQGLTPLLVVDVWEHAYYLDYQNKRPDYVNAFIDSLINWDFVAANMK